MVSVILLGIGLAMDAMAVSIVNGIKYRNYGKKEMFFSSMAFGVFQGVMPLIGYFLILPFISYVERIDHWLVFGILGVLGFHMIKEGLFEKESTCDQCATFDYKILFTEAIATSIDALSVGVSLPMLSLDPVLSCVIIGVITMILCFMSHLLGKKMGLYLKDKAIVFGGVILILIGLRTLVEHLLG